MLAAGAQSLQRLRSDKLEGFRSIDQIRRSVGRKLLGAVQEDKHTSQPSGGWQDIMIIASSPVQLHCKLRVSEMKIQVRYYIWYSLGKIPLFCLQSSLVFLHPYYIRKSSLSHLILPLTMRFTTMFLAALFTTAMAVYQPGLEGRCDCYPNCGCPTYYTCSCWEDDYSPENAPCYPHCGCPFNTHGACIAVSDSALRDDYLRG